MLAILQQERGNQERFRHFNLAIKMDDLKLLREKFNAYMSAMALMMEVCTL
jgi:hypothetical protein